MNVLVLNCFSRNALGAINSVDSSHVVYGGCALSSSTTWKLCSALKSRRIAALLHVTPPGTDPDGFKADVMRHVREKGIDLVIPTGTAETDCLSLHKAEIEAATGARLVVEDYPKHLQVTDKGMTVELCERLGIPVPRSWKVDRVEAIRDLLEAGELEFPLVMKPTRSFASVGVRFFDTREDLAAFLAGEGRTVTGAPWLLQHRISGELHDVTSCSRGGEPLMMLSQQRIITWYDFGGGGIANVTTDEPIIKEYASRIIAELGWNGILLFDFIRSAAGEYHLLECNPKIWGTTQLTVDAGLNMPQCAVEVFTGGAPERVTDYAIGMQYVWLFPYCLASVFNRPRTTRAVLARMGRIAGLLPGARTNVTKENLLHLFGTVVSRVAL